ncbi:hypothetical protein L218DRAFT_1005918 [Marasmius fiardii PR-910]|nr:hypothetical protein L218DRAFT_1005918 [Marasmius fiardii PR-910]
MAFNASSDLQLEGSMRNDGNNVHTHGPFPIMAFGVPSTSFMMPSTNCVRSEGGENQGINFQNPQAMFSGAMFPPVPPSSSGTWLANLKLAILSHKHTDATPCFHVLEHAAIADSEEDPSFIQAHTRLVQHLSAPERARRESLEKENAALTAQNTSLAAENTSLKQQIAVMHTHRDGKPNTNQSTNKRKPNSLESPDRRPPPPIPDRDEPEVIPSPPSYNDLGSEPYPSRDIATILYQHIHFRPGFDLAGSVAIWKEAGTLEIPHYIRDHLRYRTLPSILPFSGTPLGSQSLPEDSNALATLVARAHTPGNFRTLLRLRDAIGLALVLNGIGREIHASVPIPSIISSTAKANPFPEWVEHTRFLLPEDAVREFDTAETWDLDPCRIPALRAPNVGSSDEDYALFVFVHYNNPGHLGILVTDSGFVLLDSIMAYRVVASLTPPKRNGVHEFRREFVRLVTRPSLYSELLKTLRISVVPTEKLSACPVNLSKDVLGIARHLANCGVSSTKVANMFHWGMQFCLDIQGLTTVEASRRREFAEIYKYARIRSLFFPIYRPKDDRTYSIPSHIKPSEILEYRRRHFVWDHWRTTNTLPSPDFRISVKHYSRYPPKSVPISVQPLSLSDSGNAFDPPTGEHTNTGPSTVSAQATEVTAPASGEVAQSASATDDLTPRDAASSGQDFDMDNNTNQETSTNPERMEE